MIIAVPYQHLVDQWQEEAKAFGYKPILAYQSKKSWMDGLNHAIIEFNGRYRPFISVITTHATFISSDFQAAIARLQASSLLIADEAHHLGAERSRQNYPHQIPYRLALSATPDCWFDDVGTAVLRAYFGETVFAFTLEQAIGVSLTPYYYYPHLVPLTDDEMAEYEALSVKIARLINREDADKQEALKMLLIKRARVLNTAVNKLQTLSDLIDQEAHIEHTLFYCAPGQINDVMRLVGWEKGILVNQFTAEEKPKERQQLLGDFADGTLQALAAMKCLDEGVDVPSTRTAYFLASSSNPREFVQRRTELAQVIETIREKATAAYTAVAQPAITQALTILNEKRERGEIPSSIRQQFIQDLLERMVCICGRPFAEHGPEQRHLLKLLDNTVPGSLEDAVLDTSAALGAFPEKIAQQKTAINDNMRRRTELIDIIQGLDAELDDVSRQLKGSPLEEISRLENQRRDFSADIDGYILETGALSQRIEQTGKKINDLEKKISKARKEKQRGQKLSVKLELAQKAADAITEMYGAFSDDMRQRIESQTKKIFHSLVWKDSHFQDVRLGDDFNLEVIDRYDQPARPELSAGERQVLSLSFIAAMAQVSEEEAPLMMDTPFGRLSSHHRNSITEQLPKLADQLVLFVTDEELRGQARQNLNPYIGAEYRLNFDKTTSCTSIDEV